MLLEEHAGLMDEERESDGGGATAVAGSRRQIGTGVGRTLR